jgi:tripartite-type tricarboxylate transporter receptor subunit TctC
MRVKGIMATIRVAVSIRLAVLVSMAGLFLVCTAGAQSFPSRSVRYIMPLPAGSETDIFARVLAKQLSESWGQQIIVENRPGAGTTIATEFAAKAPADGHTFMHAITPFAINPTLYARLPYDTLKDFSCITRIGDLYGVLVAHPSFPARSMTDLIKLAKARPGEIAYATGGSGTTNHIAAEAMRMAAGINIAHVPYKGSSQAVLDVLPGRVPLLATVLVEAIPYIQSGKLRAIASTSPRRAPSLPDVPTIRETLPAYHAGTGFWIIVTRAGAPAAALNKLNADIVTALQAPEVRARLAQADIEIVGSRPGECDAFLRDQIAVWGKNVKASGARVD